MPPAPRRRTLASWISPVRRSVTRPLGPRRPRRPLRRPGTLSAAPRRGAPAPLALAVAETAVLIPVGVRLVVLEPQELKRHALVARQLSMHPRPVWLRPDTAPPPNSRRPTRPAVAMILPLPAPSRILRMDNLFRATVFLLAQGSLSRGWKNGPLHQSGHPAPFPYPLDSGALASRARCDNGPSEWWTSVGIGGHFVSE